MDGQAPRRAVATQLPIGIEPSRKASLFDAKTEDRL